MPRSQRLCYNQGGLNRKHWARPTGTAQADARGAPVADRMLAAGLDAKWKQVIVPPWVRGRGDGGAGGGWAPAGTVQKIW